MPQYAVLAAFVAHNVSCSGVACRQSSSPYRAIQAKPLVKATKNYLVPQHSAYII